ncbi:hypothetical protein K443DRAFT_112228 [Laccaria amethystina LaAM-08-1]|uniref:Uncharacterized protein n=1 Tax=Laccaria amethystina LaAM-08-1 TaxID=1095629 RepID=A0A0C9XAJ2_9AGAR|nr:hypothetical protein K443DRAFT_112228 [Laccaria amethystina LaAM-08-1]
MNLVDHPTAEQSELSKAEQTARVPTPLVKIATHRPKVVCFVGLGIADIFKSKVMPTRMGRKMKAAIAIQLYKLQYQDEQGKGIPSILTIDGWEKVNQFKALKSVLETVQNNNFDTSSLYALRPNDLKRVI